MSWTSFDQFSRYIRYRGIHNDNPCHEKALKTRCCVLHFRGAHRSLREASDSIKIPQLWLHFLGSGINGLQSRPSKALQYCHSHYEVFLLCRKRGESDYGSILKASTTVSPPPCETHTAMAITLKVRYETNVGLPLDRRRPGKSGKVKVHTLLYLLAQTASLLKVAKTTYSKVLMVWLRDLVPHRPQKADSKEDPFWHDRKRPSNTNHDPCIYCQVRIPCQRQP